MSIPEPSSRISLSNVSVAGDVRGGGTGREHAANLLGDGSQECVTRSIGRFCSYRLHGRSCDVAFGSK